jgi:hypothetical protein
VFRDQGFTSQGLAAAALASAPAPARAAIAGSLGDVNVMRGGDDDARGSEEATEATPRPMPARGDRPPRVIKVASWPRYQSIIRMLRQALSTEKQMVQIHVCEV